MGNNSLTPGISRRLPLVVDTDDVDCEEFLEGPPVRRQSRHMDRDVGTLHRLDKRPLVGDVAGQKLDRKSFEKRQVAAPSHEAEHAVTVTQKPFREIAANEAVGTGDQDDGHARMDKSSSTPRDAWIANPYQKEPVRRAT